MAISRSSTDRPLPQHDLREAIRPARRKVPLLFRRVCILHGDVALSLFLRLGQSIGTRADLGITGVDASTSRAARLRPSPLRPIFAATTTAATLSTRPETPNPKTSSLALRLHGLPRCTLAALLPRLPEPRIPHPITTIIIKRQRSQPCDPSLSDPPAPLHRQGATPAVSGRSGEASFRAPATLTQSRRRRTCRQPTIVATTTEAAVPTRTM